MQAALTALDELRRTAAWTRWTTLAADGAPYLTPTFFALARPLVERGEPLVATAWTPDGMTGALPLVLDGHTLRGLRTDHSPGFDYCGSPEGIAAIWQALGDDARWSELVLDKVPAASPLATALPAIARRDGCPVELRPDGRHPYFALTGFEAAMKPKFRTNVQRCARKAGDLVLEQLRAPTPADLADATAIEAMAWKGVAGTSIATDPRVVHLYAELLEQFGPHGRASLVFLRIGGVRVATLFALEDGHTLYALKIGYDPRYANLSPGHLLVWKVAADAEARGLRELDFVGREDEWKRKWTDAVHERVAITIYRRSARGLLRYALREVIKPRLPASIRESPRSPFPRHCQRADLVAAHGPAERVLIRVRRGLGLCPKLRRLVAKADPPTPAPRLGAASSFPVGSWVRVRERAAIARSLDAHETLRGLAFVGAQWGTCERVFQVEAHVRRLRDDHGRYRAVSRTVRLAGVHCALEGEHTGCGRRCPLMYRDEWLEAAPAPVRPPGPAADVRHARVRDASEIAGGLDLFGRRDGVTFMPEMAALAGRRFAIGGTLSQVFEGERWLAPRAKIYLLDGAQCTGAICGANGPCDRGCAMLWHEDWLVIEEAAGC